MLTATLSAANSLGRTKLTLGGIKGILGLQGAMQHQAAYALAVSDAE
jgi:hypothetical protein